MGAGGELVLGELGRTLGHAGHQGGAQGVQALFPQGAHGQNFGPGPGLAQPGHDRQQGLLGGRASVLLSTASTGRPERSTGRDRSLMSASRKSGLRAYRGASSTRTITWAWPRASQAASTRRLFRREPRGMLHARSVDEHDLRLGQGQDAADAVAGGLGFWGNNGQLLAQKGVEQRGLAGVWRADQGGQAEAMGAHRAVPG